MSTPRIPPVPYRGESDKSAPATDKRQIEKVEKIDQVDEEASARQQKFRKFVDEEKGQDDSEFPTPFALFSKSASPPVGVGYGIGLDELTPENIAESRGALSSPEYSPSPATFLNDTLPEASKSRPPLPNSEKFYSDIDEQQPSKMKETPGSSARTFVTKEEEEKAKKVEAHHHKKGKGKKKVTEEPLGPGAPAEVKKEQGPQAIVTGRSGSKYVASLKKEKLKETEETLVVPIKEKEEKEREGKKEEIKTPIAVQSPTITPLPEAVIPVATQAAANAQRYLGPEALAIYFRMVGTITSMVTPKGDSKTEFFLNSPSFANSKFFGSKITIERFATAPYQLNIRLTGSNEAVVAFNKNIPNLLAAFRDGKFNYSINRIDAAYERPLIRRKEEKKEKDFEGGMGEKT